jgi:hypothetical protein
MLQLAEVTGAMRMVLGIESDSHEKRAVVSLKLFGFILAPHQNPDPTVG